MTRKLFVGLFFSVHVMINAICRTKHFCDLRVSRKRGSGRTNPCKRRPLHGPPFCKWGRRFALPIIALPTPIGSGLYKYVDYTQGPLSSLCMTGAHELNRLANMSLGGNTTKTILRYCTEHTSPKTVCESVNWNTMLWSPRPRYKNQRFLITASMHRQAIHF